MEKQTFSFLIGVLLFTAKVNAQLVVVPGTFPSMDQGGGYVTQRTPIVIHETLTGDFAVTPATVTYILTAPTGYEFLPNTGTFTPYDGCYFNCINISDLYVGSMSVSATTITLTLRYMTSIYPEDDITINNLQVRALAGAPITGNILRTGGTAVYNGGNPIDAKNHGTFCSANNAVPIITYSADPYYCDLDNTNYILTASPSGGTWTGSGVTGNNFNPYILSPGSKKIKYTLITGTCYNADSINVLIKSTPTATLTSSDADNTICVGQSVTFTGTVLGATKRFQFYKNDIPVTTLSATNTYTTSLLIHGDRIKVVADNGSFTCADTSNVITMIVGEYPVALFGWENSCGSMDITYEDLTPPIAASSIAQRKWDFENDGTTDVLAIANPSTAFPSIGNYDTKFVVITDKGCSDTLSKRVTVSPGITITPDIPYTISFSASDESWFPKDTSISSWGWGPANSITIITGTRNVWATGSNSNNLYNESEVSFLNSPCFDFTALDRPMIALKIWSEAVSGFSGVMLEASIDEGNTWSVVGKKNQGQNWYNNDQGISGIANIPPQQSHPNNEGWTGTDSDWKIARFVLDSYAGEASVRIRLSFGAPTGSATTIRKGFALDSVWIGNRNKTVLIEHFTNNEWGTFCSNNALDPKRHCSAANDSVNKIQMQRPLDVISLHYHTSFPATDNFNLLNPSDPSSRVLYYGMNEAPDTRLDGTAQYKKYGQNGDSLDVIDIDSKTLGRAKFKLDLSVYLAANKITAATRLNFIDDEPLQQDIVVHIVIIEENKMDNSKNYKYILRKMLPDAAGNYISRTWLKNDQQEIVQNWDFSNGNLSEMAVIVFVQNFSTREVYQAIYKKGVGTNGDLVSAISTSEWTLEDVFVFPNPAIEKCTVLLDPIKTEFCQWELIDNLGRTILVGEEKNKSFFEIPTQELSNGLYTLKIGNESNRMVQKKIMIIH